MRALHRFVVVWLGLATALVAAPALALIVWEGKIVQEWPDQAAHRGPLPGGTVAASGPMGFYPNPQGEVWGLTIVVDFSDQPPAFTRDQIDAWLNQPGYSEGNLNGSVRDYFHDNSNGAVSFQNEVVGIYRAAQPKSYYEGGNGYERAAELVDELLDRVDDEVDFSRFDNDGDGRTEAISIVYAGPAETWGQGLWPHAGGLRDTRDGVRLTRYQMTNMGERLGLYTFAHEIGHMLFGWPDLYGFGNYCIMGNSSSSTNPVGINDFYRADQGWIDVVDVDASTNALFEAKVNGAGYRYVNPDRPEEAFFWSNIQNTNRWSTLRGSGLVVLHFDHEIRNNNPPNPLSLAVVQADGRKDLDQTMWPNPGSEQGDFFRADGNSELSGMTTPDSSWNDGTDSGLRIYAIGESGSTMTFAVGHGEPVDGTGGAAGAGGSAGDPGTGTGGNDGGNGGNGTGGIGGTVTGGATGSGGSGAGAGGGNGGFGAAGGSGGTAVVGSGGSVSSGATAGTGDVGASGAFNPDPAPNEPVDGGCACHLHGATTGPRTPHLLASFALLLAGAARRRRRRS